jgi:hypothetical protein
VLAQSFMTATDLGITEPHKDALIKTLVLLETGKLVHSESKTGKLVHSESSLKPSYSPKFTGHFNMASWCAEGSCGTVCCIGGTAEIISGTSFKLRNLPEKLDELFFIRPRPHGCDWHDVTPEQAATALRSYLTTGDARWDLAVLS